MTNSNFGKLEEYGTVTYAPSYVITDEGLVVNPDASDYAKLGWLPVIAEKPAGEKLGVEYVPSGWEMRDGAIYRTFEERPIIAPTTVRRYSKLRIITAAKAIGKWDILKLWISQAGLTDEWAACMYLADDYPGFNDIKSAIVQAKIATEDEIRQILDESRDDTLKETLP